LVLSAPLRGGTYDGLLGRVVEPIRRRGIPPAGTVLRGRRVPARVVAPSHQRKRDVRIARGPRTVLPCPPRGAPPSAGADGRRQQRHGGHVQQGMFAQPSSSGSSSCERSKSSDYIPQMGAVRGESSGRRHHAAANARGPPFAAGDLPLAGKGLWSVHGRPHGLVRECATQPFADQGRTAAALLFFQIQLGGLGRGRCVSAERSAYPRTRYPRFWILLHIVHHMADCGAHAAVVLPDLHEYWALRVRRATVREVALSPTGIFGFPHHRNGVREFVYGRHGMRAVELDFRGHA